MELGATFRKTREEQGKTLEDVQEYTKVRKEFLDALEKEDFHYLPPRVYTIGFIKKYASYLNIDAAPLISLVPNDADSEPTLEPLATVGDVPRPWATWLATGVVVFILVAILGVRIVQGTDSSNRSQGVVVAQIPNAPTTQSGDSSGDVSNPAGISGQPTPTPGPARTPTPAVRPSLTPQPTSESKLMVPPLTGVQMEMARSRLQSLGLAMNVEEVWSDSAPVGVLLGQKPAAGQEISRGELVLVLVSKGPDDKITVPNVIGMPEKQAQGILAQAGLVNSPWVNYQGQEQVPPSVLSSVCGGCVLSTTPSPGQVVDKGTTISMAVRRE